MSLARSRDADLAPRPNVDHLVTEDDTPVDNLFCAWQRHLLVEPLYASWGDPQGRGMLAVADVGIFWHVDRPAIVPDVLLSLDVEVPGDWWAKHNRSYFVWEYGKSPDVVIEVVSNKIGEEFGEKLGTYSRMRVPYYAIYDPQSPYRKGVFHLYRLSPGKRTLYAAMPRPWMPDLGLGLTLWEGEYRGRHDVWLRWCDEQRRPLATGEERAEQESRRAAEESRRAEEERARRLEAEQELDRLRQLLQERSPGE